MNYHDTLTIILQRWLAAKALPQLSADEVLRRFDLKDGEDRFLFLFIECWDNEDDKDLFTQLIIMLVE